MSKRLEINQHTLLKDIKNNFNQYYPFLKLEFFLSPHKALKLSSKHQLIDVKLSVKNVAAKIGENVYIDISENRKVSAVEQDFWQLLGFGAQVFRKSINAWIGTSLTDNWTLQQQNSEGEQLSTLHKKPLEDRLEDQQFDTK